ncbi:sporulation integral membrane protein YtvI [Lottiidibacillus patelloidae]|uniref:Sporulation integral membrane protein YtvI n=1 Tax=Lottiidibacillus patelloidae TaxID=2670334 RepID=A0A263BXK6_9BACI|nr:sporulation integral membrane protein YtvI [Lottiidibacillus patelloidae]OZM58469.1 sporulation integral membrane protein YtvI [Lottiidibacillus patelloidae]
MANFFTKQKILFLFLIITVVLIGYWILPVSLPIIIALVTAMMLEPAVKMFERYKIKRRMSILIVFTLFLCLIGLSGYLLVTKIVTEGINVVKNSPKYIEDINNLWLKFEEKMNNASQDLPKELVAEINKNVNNYFAGIQEKLENVNWITEVTEIGALLPNYLVSFLVYLIALFLFLIELPKIKERFYAHLTKKTADKVSFMSTRLSSVMFGFLKAQFFVSIIIFIVALIGLLFITPKYALIMSLIIWIVDLIPIIGSIAILGPWSLYHYIAGDVVLGTKLLILGAILLVIRRTIEPKVMGQHIGLSPLATLIAMYIGLKLFGMIGFFIGPFIVIFFNSAREAGLIKFKFKL